MNPRVVEIQSSLIRKIAAKKRPTSIDLGLGEPTLMPTAAHLEHAMQFARERGLRYTLNAGDAALREAIASHYAYPEMNLAENVVVTTGSQEAMYVALKTLLNPQTDELLLVEPCFPSYAKMAVLEGVAGRSIAMNEADDFAFDAERIASAVTDRTRAIVICSPCNPTARVMTRAEGEKLVAALEARRREPVWIVHDEIYREQCFIDDPVEFAKIYPYTIVTNSLSKSNALTGLRLGWFIGPAPFVEQAAKVHAWVVSCTDTFAQAVARSVFSTDRALHEHTPWYRVQRQTVLDALQKSGLRFLPVDGSFYACVRLPDGAKSLDAAIALVDEHDVVAIPGIAFGQNFDSWLRLSWVGESELVRQGIDRLVAFVQSTTVSSRT